MSKTSRNRFLLIFGTILVVLLGLGLLGVIIADPDRKADCPKGDEICGKPPKPPTSSITSWA